VGARCRRRGGGALRCLPQSSPMKLPPYAAAHARAAKAGFAPKNKLVGVLLGWPGKRPPVIWRHAGWGCALPPHGGAASDDWHWGAGMDVVVAECVLRPDASLSAIQACLRAISAQVGTSHLLGVSRSARRMIEAP